MRRTSTHTSRLRNAVSRNGPPNAPISIKEPRPPKASAYPPVISPNTIETARNIGAQTPNTVATARASRAEYILRSFRNIQTAAAHVGERTVNINTGSAALDFLSGSKPNLDSANISPMLPTVMMSVARPTIEENRTALRNDVLEKYTP
jgi:hypothetical protein